MTDPAHNGLFQGRFELRRELGQGATGIVYEAWDGEHGRIVAIKQLNRVDPQSLYLLKHEFRSAGEITHPNLARLGELFSEGDAVFFTMERVHGVDFLTHVRTGEPDALRDAPTLVRPTRKGSDPPPSGEADGSSVDRSRPSFDEAALRAALKQLFEGLRALHAHGKVHRDVKPSNVLVEPSGRVVLLDFGLTADALGREDREHGWIVGTPRYMAPEQVRDEKVGPAADAYATGVMLHEALVGRPPLDGSSREIMFGKQLLVVSSLAERFPFVPSDLDALCCELLRAEPKGRPTDEEVLRRLGADTDAPSIARRGPSAVFVGRRRELSALQRAYSDAREGSVIALVRGESGVGKSALVHRFVTELRESQPDVRVLRGRCFERENIPFNAIDAVVDALSMHLGGDAPPDNLALGDPRDLAALARVFPVLRRSHAVEWAVMDNPLPDASPQDLRLRAFRALGHLLRELGRGAPVVVAIDDLQWADKDSLALLDELTVRAEAPPLLLLATLRPGGRIGPLAEGDRDVRWLELTGLDADEAKELATAIASSLELDSLDSESLIQEARGHPLYLLELLQLAEPGSARPSLDDALRLRAAALGPEIRRVLELVALAGVPTRQGVIAEAAGVGTADCLGAVDELRRGLFVRTDGTGAGDAVEPYHDRVREALLDALPTEQRREGHRRLADALERRMRDPRDRAVLVHQLEQAGELARAASHAEQAAAESAHALAFDQAAELYRLALRLGEHGPDERAGLLLACAHALRDAGRGREAAECFLEASARQSPDERLALEVAAAEQWVACGHLERGFGLLEEVLARLGVRWPRSQPEVLAAFALERAALAAEGLEERRGGRLGRLFPGGADTGATLDPAARRRLEVFQSIASGLGSVDPLRAWIFQTRALRTILRTGEPELLAIGLALESLMAGLEGAAGSTHVRRLVARAQELARGSKDARVQAWALLADGGTNYFLGRLGSASGPLAEAEMRFRDEVRVDSGGLNVTRILKVWTAVFRGDLRQLGRWIPEYERDARRRDDRYAQVSLNLAGHVGWLVDGDLARARAKVAERVWSPPGGAYHIQTWYELFADCEQALYASADGGEPFDERTRAKLERGFSALRTSLVFMRAESVRLVGIWTMARYLVAGAEQGVARRRSIRQARVLASLLARGRPAYAPPYAAAIRAACHALEGDHAAAVVELRLCAELAEEASLFGIAAMAKRRLGELADRADQRGVAERFFRAQGVADPARITGMYLPGFDRRR